MVQLLFYLLVTVTFVGVMSYNGRPFIPPDIRNVLIGSILILMIAFIIYYYYRKEIIKINCDVELQFKKHFLLIKKIAHIPLNSEYY